MIRDDFRMHRARVFLSLVFLLLLPLLVIVLDVRAIRVNRAYLRARYEHECADKN